MKTKFSRLLGFRLVFLLLSATIVFVAVYTYMNIHVHNSHLMDNVLLSANMVSDVIKRSTHYSMLLNRREDLHHTILTIGNEPGIDGIRVYNKKGEIMFSTITGEKGTSVDLQAEACYICHAREKPLEAIPTEDRVRIYASPQGHRILGVINPVMNEPLCYNAECHAHPAGQKVLGVLDVKMSLRQVDTSIGASRRNMIAYGIAFVILIGALSAGFILKMVHNPVKKLILGTREIAKGNLDYAIDLQVQNEMGSLAKSFNLMTHDLKKARDEIMEWSSTLEDKVREKTEALEKAQASMIQMEKMASIGKLSATVAHEINNPLAGVLTYAKLILKMCNKECISPEEKTSMEKYLNIIKNETGRCGDIVKNLLLFSKKTGGDFHMEHLDTIVVNSLELIDHHLKIEGIALVKDLRPGDDQVYCDANQIRQALIALFVNAVEAMPKGGTLSVRTDFDEENRSVRLFISDTGHGIPEEIRSKIFEPFFSTKMDGKGVGLGLPVVYGIIKRHHGSIEVISKANQGTTFVISLPRDQKQDRQEEIDGEMEMVI